MTDTTSDLLTRLRNAKKQKFESVEMPDSRVKQSILKILKSEGYIRNYSVRKRKSFGVIKVLMKYTPEGEPSFDKIDRISKPGRRIYVDKNNIPTIAGGMGTAIISTSQGMMTTTEAKKRGVGGELICKIQ
ncbi:MAG: 30S ribosomal protein S8 [bacterium]